MKIINEIKLAVPAEQAWKIIGEQYGDAAQWTSVLEASSLIGELGVGAIRTCHSRAVGPFPASIVEERLTMFEPANYRLTYVAEKGLPGIFKKATNAWSIQPVDHNSCVVTSRAELKISVWLFPVKWIFPILISRDLKKVFEELQYYIERGKFHPRKIQSKLEPAKS